MSALAAALSAVGVGLLSGIASLIKQLFFGQPIWAGWQIAGWISVSVEVLALGLLVLHVQQGKIFAESAPAVGQSFSRQARNLIRPWTPRPYSLVVFVGGVVAILLTTRLAIVPVPPPPPPPPPPPCATPPPCPVPPPPPPVPNFWTYTVRPGDTLFAVAERFYGDGSQYPQIADASSVADPNLIHPGQVLTIPWPPRATHH
jgi:nucleoid-associated protein YgaU